jgi:hypothetical protein
VWWIKPYYKNRNVTLQIVHNSLTFIRVLKFYSIILVQIESNAGHLLPSRFPVTSFCDATTWEIWSQNTSSTTHICKLPSLASKHLACSVHVNGVSRCEYLHAPLNAGEHMPLSESYKTPFENATCLSSQQCELNRDLGCAHFRMLFDDADVLCTNYTTALWQRVYVWQRLSSVYRIFTTRIAGAVQGAHANLFLAPRRKQLAPRAF